jgi:hypothetical protein
MRRDSFWQIPRLTHVPTSDFVIFVKMTNDTHMTTMNVEITTMHTEFQPFQISTAPSRENGS